MLINGDIDEVFAAYQSPIGVLRMRFAQDVAQKIDKMAEESVMQALEEMHIDVDKAELLKALSYDRDQYARGYEDGKAAAQPKWISVEDAMPDQWKTADGTFINYLVYIPKYGVDIGNYIQPDKTWVCMGFLAKVTHWMPLPEPPGGKR